MAWLDIKFIHRDHPHLLDGRDVALKLSDGTRVAGRWSREHTCWIESNGEISPEFYSADET